MFSKKLSADGYTSLISPRTTITGAISYEGTLKVQGKIAGHHIDYRRDLEVTKHDATLILDESGEILTNEVMAMNAIIKGHLACKKLMVEDILRVHSSARLECVVIYYRTLEIEPGAMLQDCRLIHLDRTSEGEIV